MADADNLPDVGDQTKSAPDELVEPKTTFPTLELPRGAFDVLLEKMTERMEKSDR